MKNSQKFPTEWEAFQRCGSSRFLSVEEQFDAHLDVIGRYSQLLKNKHKEIVLDPESIGFTSNQRPPILLIILKKQISKKVMTLFF